MPHPSGSKYDRKVSLFGPLLTRGSYRRYFTCSCSAVDFGSYFYHFSKHLWVRTEFQMYSKGYFVVSSVIFWLVQPEVSAYWTLYFVRILVLLPQVDYFKNRSVCTVFLHRGFEYLDAAYEQYWSLGTVIFVCFFGGK